MYKWYSNNARQDRYAIQVNECVTTQTRSQDDVLTCTFLVSSATLSLQSFNVANILSFYAFSFPPFQVFPYLFWASPTSSYIKDIPLYPFNMNNGLHHQSFNLHMLRQ